MNTNETPTAEPLAPLTGSAWLAAYERRRNHTEESLAFWMGELAGNGDDFARVQMNRIRTILGDVNEQIHTLAQPSTRVIREPNAELTHPDPKP